MFENMPDSARNFANNVVRKTQDAIDYSKKKLSCLEVENELDMNYKKLGKAVYGKFTVQDFENEQEISGLLGRISALEHELKRRNGEIVEENGVKICPSCLSENPETSSFCGECGHKL